VTNREVAERHIEVSNRLAIEEIEQVLTEDVVWDMSRSVGPFRGVYQGDAEVRPLLMSYVEAFESIVATPLEWHERGDWMAIDIRVRIRGRGSGAEVEARGARVYEFRDGKIARFVQFQNFADAREYVDAQA
jgi:ketosteroid isomerase-like protein